MNESALRDLIAQKIHQLKPGLTLLQKEQYIPNAHGTRSFIDLYAKDEEGRHVLIELKRSGAAARQAIHEVNKYVEGVKQYFGAKDSEVHIIIASTAWEELLVPFSRFFADAGFSVEGILLKLADHDEDFKAEPIKPLPLTQGRFIAPWHHVYWYADETAFKQGIAGIESAYREKGIDDYLIVQFHMPDHSTPEERSAAIQAAAARMAGVPEQEMTADFSVPAYEYIAYTALQMLPEETCLHIISRDRGLLDEVQERLPEMEEEEAACFLHEYVEATAPSPKCDSYEIGYPAKFSKFFEAENCSLYGIVRHGIFQRNAMLKDETLYAELRGEDGSTGQKFKCVVDMKNTALVKNLKRDIANALESNPVWRSHIGRILEEIERDFPEAEIDVSIFNPCTGVFTIYYAMVKERGFLYLPAYRIMVRNPHGVRGYYGALEATETALTFPQLLRKYYGGNLTALLVTATWGGRDGRDSDIIEDLGARYSSYRFDMSGDQITGFSTLRDEKWRPCKTVSIFGLFKAYRETHRKLVNQIFSQIGYHGQGGFFVSAGPDTALEKYADMTAAQKQQVYYSGAPDVCDICKRPFAHEKFMIDGEVRDHGPWANMCGYCFSQYGGKIGQGHGQLYQKDKGGWLLVGGFGPDFESK